MAFRIGNKEDKSACAREADRNRRRPVADDAKEAATSTFCGVFPEDDGKAATDVDASFFGMGLRRPRALKNFDQAPLPPSRRDAAGGKAGAKWDLLRRIAKKSVCLPRPVAFAPESPYNDRDLHKGGRSFSAWFLSTPTASGQARLFRCGFIFPPSCLNAPFSWARARFSDASGFSRPTFPSTFDVEPFDVDGF